MNYFEQFTHNYMLICALCGWFSAQIIKMIICLITERKFKPMTMLFSSGGMPSSHASTVMALCAASVIKFGLDSSQFAITAILAMIVMIDASGVRYETGEQAKILNKITKELFSGKSEEVNTGLKELVGHTPFQVVIGALLGVTVAAVLGFLMNIY